MLAFKLFGVQQLLLRVSTCAVHAQPLAHMRSEPAWSPPVLNLIAACCVLLFLFSFWLLQVTGNQRWKGMTWGMMPSLGSAMAACTWHFFYNSPGGGTSTTHGGQGTDTIWCCMHAVLCQRVEGGGCGGCLSNGWVATCTVCTLLACMHAPTHPIPFLAVFACLARCTAPTCS
jgi:hypothetical protein